MAAPATLSTWLESIDPSSGEVIARFQATPSAGVAVIVTRARQAQADWAQRPLRDRCALIECLHGTIHARRMEIAELISREVGKPRVEALFSEVITSLDACRYYAAKAKELLRAERVPHHNPALKGKSGWLQYEPCGVLGIISPWNYPMGIPLGQIVPAVVVGNTVVLKPSELVPWCGAMMAELFAQAGFPEGVIEVVQGGGDVGAALIDAGPDKVLFTGSVATGRRVAEACARRLIPSVLELGGKDAMIVLADADLEVASSAAVWGSFTNCGQACLSVERLYVERSVSERFSELCLEKTRRLKLGPPAEPDAEIGPMIRLAQLERVEEQLREAVARGARILCGGRRRPDLGPYFFEPTVVVDADHSMRLMQEETFGPVLAICSVANGAEAVALANDSAFGLAASVWTRDAARGRQIAAKLKAGAVMINDVASYFGICEAPHGGRGASGWGRTHGRVGLLEMVQVKYVDVDRLPGWPKPWWFGYDEQLSEAADRLVQFLFAPGWKQRLQSAGGALGAVFRRHRM